MKKTLLSISLLIIILLAVCSCSSSKAYNYNLKDYIKVGKYEGVEYVTPTVTEDDIDKQIKKELKENGQTTLVEVTDRGVIDGDTTNIDFTGKINGKEFEGGTAQGQDLVIGSGKFIPGFEDKMIGMKTGETKDLDLTFPEDYSTSELAGKDVVFTVKVNKISADKYNKLTNDVVKEISSYETVAEYKDYIKEDLTKNKKEEAFNATWKIILDECEVIKYPEKEVNNYIKKLKEYYENIAEQNSLTFEDFLKSQNLTTDSFNESMKSVAEQSVKEEMAIMFIAREQNFKITSDIYQEKATQYAKDYKYGSLQALEDAVEKSIINLWIYKDMVHDYILSKANIK